MRTNTPSRPLSQHYQNALFREFVFIILSTTTATREVGRPVDVSKNMQNSTLTREDLEYWTAHPELPALVSHVLVKGEDTELKWQFVLTRRGCTIIAPA